MKNNKKILFKAAVLGSVLSVGLSGCGFSPYSLPLPGGADVGSDPYQVKVEFRDVLDLVPQSAVRVNDVAVGKVRKIELNGWTAVVTLQINRDAKLPDNAEATIRLTSLLGEKFVSLAAPKTGSVGSLGDGDVIPIQRSGRNPEIEEVLGAASLLFNGGGLEKTQTIVKELNKTLDGNEPEIKELLRTTDTFISQLDQNKQDLITSLEKVNNLAVETNKQKSAITGALDNLPAALRVVNEQRDDLVKLLQALDRLSDVGTNVVKESKADTIADLKALGPILRRLADSGDDLPKSLMALLTFPFPDGAVGGANSVAGAEDYHKGDFTNLFATMDISLDQLTGFLGLPDLSGAGLLAAQEQAKGADPLTDLADLVGGLVPELPGLDGVLPGAKPTEGTTSQGTPPTPTATPGLELPQFCSLLGKCRVAPSSVAKAARSDVGRLLIQPVVAS
ncbi:MAG: MCE family protein [Actinomycetota bacterium]|nr:MCE family protein [Actinomycetota bacterium]